MHFNLANHSSAIVHANQASTPSVKIFVTADRVLWRGETPDRVEWELLSCGSDLGVLPFAIWCDANF